MRVAVLEVCLRMPWVHSLKEKRMLAKSLQAKIRDKFHVSVAETGAQDIHQTLQLGMAAVVAHTAQADSVLQNLLKFIEGSTEADVQVLQSELW